MPLPAPPDLESTHVVQRCDGVCLAVRRDWSEQLPLGALLAGAPMADCGRPLSGHGLRGRARLQVLETSAGQLVVKTLSRGGWLGHCLPGLYRDPWRPAREAALVEQLALLDVPCAPIVVARATATLAGLWRCELASVRLSGAVDLLQALQRTPTEDWGSLAAATGRTLARVHQLGLLHRDLQVKNLLVPGGSWCDQSGLLAVIDLDGSGLGRPLDLQQRLAALTRFGRSLVKRRLLPGRAGGAVVLPGAAMRAFLRGYAWREGPSRAVLLGLLSRRLRRQVAMHRLFWSGAGVTGPDLPPRGQGRAEA